jgi:hypothetical protein
MKTLLAGIVVPVGVPAIYKATDVPNPSIVHEIDKKT